MSPISATGLYGRRSLFAAKGAEGVTMRELASALGVSPMTPYRYFHDKDDMLAAVRARAFDRFAEARKVPVPNRARPSRRGARQRTSLYLSRSRSPKLTG